MSLAKYSNSSWGVFVGFTRVINVTTVKHVRQVVYLHRVKYWNETSDTCARSADFTRFADFFHERATEKLGVLCEKSLQTLHENTLHLWTHISPSKVLKYCHRDVFAGHDLAWADVQICSPPPSSYLACHAELEDWTETGGDRNSEREAAAKGGGNLVMKPSGDYSHARVLASIEVILWKGRHSSYLDSKGSKKIMPEFEIN